MTNQEKLQMMGFVDFSKYLNSPIRLVICDQAPFLSYFDKISAYTTLHNPVSTNTSSHATNVCQTIKMVADYCSIGVELHYTNSLIQAVEVAMNFGCKVISRSVSTQQMNDNDESTKAIKQFIEYGGVWVNSAGNDLQGNNSPTDIREDLGISVGCVNDSDNSGSFIVSHSAWNLPSLNGSDNIFTHTSSATPVIAFIVAVVIELYGYNFDQVKQWLKDNSTINVKDTTERVLMIGDIDMERVIKFTIGSKIYSIDGVDYGMDTVAVLDANYRTLVPIRYIASALGVPNDDYHIKYDKATKTATIIQEI